ncbi:hypothetical protein [Stella sp.]|uniref:hypothetical protein n=1 Tax=Stella sp. TaxID=2912054 RepID=UPI0035AFB936
MVRRRPGVRAAMLATLAAAVPRPAGADAFDAAVRALAVSARAPAPAGEDLLGEPGAGPSGWLVRRQSERIEQAFLVETLQVVRSHLPLPPGLGLAVSVYDVLDGRKSPAEFVVGYVGGEAMDVVFTTVQGAMLALAAKSAAGGGALSAAGVGLPAAAPAVAPATGAAGGTLTVVRVGAAAPGLWGELVLFGAVGVATVATAAASALVGWGWRHHQEESWRSAEAEGLLQGAERAVARPPLPAR